MATCRLMFCFVATAMAIVAADKRIITFDGTEDTTFTWRTRDDPVMGGSSKSSWQVANERGSWAGQVNIVWFLNAAGFCHVEASDYMGDWSSAGVDGSVVVHYRINSQNQGQPSATNIANFGFEFDSGRRTNYKKGQFVCPMPLDLKTPWGVSRTVTVPFSSCAQSWRGQPQGGRPSLQQLKSIRNVGFITGSWDNGKESGSAGQFDLEFESISISTSSSPKKVQKPPTTNTGDSSSSWQEAFTGPKQDTVVITGRRNLRR